MQHDYSLVFETDNEYWNRVLEIFTKNEKYPKKRVSNRNLHHKFPRSFSKMLGEPVDNDSDNLISLSLADHFLVHYYYYLLAKKGFRQRMATAFTFMAKKGLKYMTPETAEQMAKDYEEAVVIVNKFKCDTQKGRRHSEESINKMRNVKHDNEWNKHVSQSLTGKHLSKEHKDNVSKGLRNYHLEHPDEISKGNLDMHWFTDGESEIMTYTCPPGFKEGRITRNNKLRTEFGELFESYYHMHRSDDVKLYMKEYSYWKRNGRLRGI